MFTYLFVRYFGFIVACTGDTIEFRKLYLLFVKEFVETHNKVI